jgi:spermidine/putrescine transport system permease protein
VRRAQFSPGALYYALMAAFLYLPLLLLVVFSFNDSPTLAFPLKGFTTRWYGELLLAGELLAALRNSLLVAAGASLVATVLGTMAALALTRFEFPGKGAFLALAAMPLVIPYVVLGVALLIAFSQAGIKLSLWTVGLGHVVVSVPYVLLIVMARLAGFEANLEEAAMDLGESYWGALRRVTLPMAGPALLAAYLNAFTTSFDEFALSFFLTGSETTLPIYLYSQLRFPARLPLVVALAALLIVGSLLVLLISEWLRRLGPPSGKEPAL